MKLFFSFIIYFLKQKTMVLHEMWTKCQSNVEKSVEGGGGRGGERAEGKQDGRSHHLTHWAATSLRVKQEKLYQPLCERNGHCTEWYACTWAFPSIVFSKFLKEQCLLKMCTPAPPHPGWTPKGAVCEGIFVATVLLSSDSLYDHLGF